MKSCIIFISLFLIFSHFVHAQYDVRVTCQACSISCPSANCYRLQSDGLDHQVCRGSDSCDVNTNYTVTINQCGSNFYGGNCNNRVCYYPKNQFACASSLLSQDSCADPYWLFVGCANCASTSNCQFCRKFQTASNNFETCIGNSCNGLGNVNISIQQCPNTMDSYSRHCNCCFNVTGDSAGNLGVCIQDSDLFVNQDFVNWSRDKLGVSGNNEFFMMAGFVLLGVLMMMLY